MAQNKTVIILDTDPGIDDAVALMAALFEETIDLSLITTVSGNVSIDKTTNNALKLLNFFNKTVPVAAGAAMPLMREAIHAEHIHGPSGLAGYQFDPPTTEPLAEHAVIAMRKQLLQSEGKITLVAIGPLTNIALLLIQYPECRDKIAKIIIMGGSTERGNTRPTAEFNIAVDPEAAHRVFTCGLPIVMCGLNVTRYALLTDELLQKLANLNKTGKMIYSLFKNKNSKTKNSGRELHDLCTIAYLADPTLFTTTEAFVAIETQGELTAGTTCVDLLNRWKKPANVTVCCDLDVPRFQQWFLATVTKAG